MKTTDGIEFDYDTMSKLQKDYNHHARMTTFNGQAVIVGIVVSSYNNKFARAANKYVEVFDSDKNKWSLKSPNDENIMDENINIAFITQFALVPLKNTLLHMGGNDIGSGNSNFGARTFYLDSMYKEWTRMGIG